MKNKAKVDIAATGVAGCFVGAVALLFIFAIAIGISSLIALIFMASWNYAAVPIFHATAVTFWQAYAITVLLGIVGSYFRSSGSKE